jgi:hypothetical protein
MRESFVRADPERVSRALAVRGPRVNGRAERRAPVEPLGAAARLQLAVLSERAPAGEPLGRITFEELIEIVALHEEGHLCDRTRLFPPGENWMNLLVLLLRAGLDPGTLARRFEYRAQLVALCEASEPRLALAQLLGESGSNGITPHHEAYAELLDDFLGVLEQGLMGEAETFAGIDLEYGLVHQLHHLTAQEVRRVGLGVARREFGTRPIP